MMPTAFHRKRLVACALVAATAAMIIVNRCYGADPQDNALPELASGQCWRLDWADEFNGNSLDLTKWNAVKDGPRGPGFWRGDHIRIHDGVAEFLISRERGKIVSAGISTERRYETIMGLFVMRAKMPSAGGFRPAFWLSSEAINRVNDPRKPTEIDVIEYPARRGRIHHNLHWNGYGAYHETVGASPLVLVSPTHFHTYAVWWSKDGYRFYVDGRQTWMSAGNGSAALPEFMRLGDEIMAEDISESAAAGDGGGSPNFTVDFVRVYKPRSCR